MLDGSFFEMSLNEAATCDMDVDYFTPAPAPQAPLPTRHTFSPEMLAGFCAS
jgi:hypothetical protein